MRENEIKEIRGKRATLTETTSLGIDLRDLTCIPNAKFGRAIQRKYCVNEKGGNTKKTERGLDSEERN